MIREGTSVFFVLDPGKLITGVGGGRRAGRLKVRWQKNNNS